MRIIQPVIAFGERELLKCQETKQFCDCAKNVFWPPPDLPFRAWVRQNVCLSLRKSHFYENSVFPTFLVAEHFPKKWPRNYSGKRPLRIKIPLVNDTFSTAKLVIILAPRRNFRGPLGDDFFPTQLNRRFLGRRKARRIFDYVLDAFRDRFGRLF